MLHHTGLASVAQQGVLLQNDEEKAMRKLPSGLLTIFKETMGLRDLLRNQKKEYERQRKIREA